MGAGVDSVCLIPLDGVSSRVSALLGLRWLCHCSVLTFGVLLSAGLKFYWFVLCMLLGNWCTECGRQDNLSCLGIGSFGCTKICHSVFVG